MRRSTRSILPERDGRSRASEDRSQSLHRGVSCEDDDFAGLWSEGGGPVDRGGPLVDHFDPLTRESGVLEPQGKVSATQPGDDRVLDGRRESLEIGVPDPRNVAPVRVPVAERGEETWLPPRLEERSDRRVEAGGVLHEDES